MNIFERINSIADVGTFNEYEDDIDIGRTYINEDYQAKIERHRNKYGINEAVITGKARVCGHDVAIGIMDARFLRASMGYYVGEKITRLFERAGNEDLPVIMFCASGGARMQEGIISLMQMQKTSQACVRHGMKGLLYISVLTNPTMGGVTASFATLADIIIAEENALIGFTGKRVISQTTGEVLPEGFQTADFQKEHGLVDEVVAESDMKEYLGKILDIATCKGKAARICVNPNDKCLNIDATMSQHQNSVIDNKLKESRYKIDDIVSNDNGKCNRENKKDSIVNCKDNQNKKIKESAWDNVRLARKFSRPTALDYIDELFDGFVELHGDRICADDHAAVAGLATFNGRPVVVIGQQKGKPGIEEALYRNWGMVSPSGHRKVIRILKMAEKFKFPVVMFVDTMGAACGKNAEEMGQANAISNILAIASELKTATLSIIIGEAGSGGALSFSVANEVWMLEHSVFSVITPEGYASIVWKDSERKSEAAEIMGMCADSLLEQNVIDRIISESEPVTKENLKEICYEISKNMDDFFDKYCAMSREEIVERRYERYRKF